MKTNVLVTAEETRHTMYRQQQHRSLSEQCLSATIIEEAVVVVCMMEITAWACNIT